MEKFKRSSEAINIENNRSNPGNCFYSKLCPHCLKIILYEPIFIQNIYLLEQIFSQVIVYIQGPVIGIYGLFMFGFSFSQGRVPALHGKGGGISLLLAKNTKARMTSEDTPLP
jgi:hypothetical protein